jgi:acyl-CoA thioesterase-1
MNYHRNALRGLVSTQKRQGTALFTHSLRWLLMLWMILLASTVHATNNRPNLLVIGDSLSAAFGIPWESGWVQLLGKEYQSSWNVVNASITGDTSGGGLARMPALMAEHKPAIVIIELGGNDGLRGYPLKTIENNLKQMIELAQAQNAQVVLAGMQIPPNYGKRYTEGFYGIYQSLAASHNTPLIPFLLDNVATKPELMQADGIHPKQEAQSLILQTVLNTLKPLLINNQPSKPLLNSATELKSTTETAGSKKTL